MWSCQKRRGGVAPHRGERMGALTHLEDLSPSDIAAGPPSGLSPRHPVPADALRRD